MTRARSDHLHAGTEAKLGAQETISAVRSCLLFLVIKIYCRDLKREQGCISSNNCLLIKALSYLIIFHPRPPTSRVINKATFSIPKSSDGFQQEPAAVGSSIMKSEGDQTRHRFPNLVSYLDTGIIGAFLLDSASHQSSPHHLCRVFSISNSAGYASRNSVMESCHACRVKFPHHAEVYSQ